MADQKAKKAALTTFTLRVAKVLQKLIAQIIQARKPLKTKGLRAFVSQGSLFPLLKTICILNNSACAF
jgi:hypothetical protein